MTRRIFSIMSMLAVAVFFASGLRVAAFELNDFEILEWRCDSLDFSAFSYVVDRDNTGEGKESYYMEIVDGAGNVLLTQENLRPVGVSNDPGAGTLDFDLPAGDNDITLRWISREGNGFDEQVFFEESVTLECIIDPPYPPTATPTLTETPTDVAPGSTPVAPTQTPTSTRTTAPTHTDIPTHTEAPTETDLPSQTSTQVLTTTASNTDMATSTATATVTATSTATLTATPTLTATASATATPTSTETSMPTETPTLEPTAIVSRCSVSAQVISEPSVNTAVNQNVLDVVFVVANTSGLSDELRKIQTRAPEVFELMDRNGLDWRAAVVLYSAGPQPVNQVLVNFSNDLDDLMNGLYGILTEARNSQPIDALDAVATSLQLPWRPEARKAVMLLSDGFRLDIRPEKPYQLIDVIQGANDAGGVRIYSLLTRYDEIPRPPYLTMADATQGEVMSTPSVERFGETFTRIMETIINPWIGPGQQAQVSSLEGVLPMRTVPSLTGNVIGNVYRGDVVTVINGPILICDNSLREIQQHELVWWQIEVAGGVTGWVPGRVSNEPQLLRYNEANPLTSVVCQLTTVDSINIRREPSLLSEVVSMRTGPNHILAASAQYGNPANPWEHWWLLIDGYWVRHDTVNEAEACTILPYIGQPPS